MKFIKLVETKIEYFYCTKLSNWAWSWLRHTALLSLVVGGGLRVVVVCLWRTLTLLLCTFCAHAELVVVR